MYILHMYIQGCISLEGILNSHRIHSIVGYFSDFIHREVSSSLETSH